jgi:hypothetical protein
MIAEHSPELTHLRAKYPWPSEEPECQEDWFGWLCNETADMLEAKIRGDMRLIVELGTFLGFSARAILFDAPSADLICVDTWRGSPEHLAPDAPDAWKNRIAMLYQGFLKNLWPWRDRVTPVREDSIDGMQAIFDCGLYPDLIYVDSEHTSDRVSRELDFITAHWPRAAIVGDDYNNSAVQLAADRHAEISHRFLSHNVAAFYFPGLDQ